MLKQFVIQKTVIYLYSTNKQTIMKTYYAKSKLEHYTFRALTILDARHWIINHLDCSQEWILGEVINPTRQPTK